MRNIHCTFALIVTAAAAWGQVSTGIISGTVTDASSSVIPAAQIKVTNVDTGIVRKLVSDSVGVYVASNLPPGHYSVEAQQPGFQLESRVGLVLSIDQTLTINFQLRPGAVTENVKVVARSEQLVQTATSSLGQVIEEKPVRDLPLNGRNYQQLILLTPGAVSGTAGQFTGGKYHLNGGRGEGNDFQIDGVDVSSSLIDDVVVNPSVEGIGEFKILTNNFTAEYGRTAGGVISVSTKAGTNEFHGTMFEFIRNNDLDARNFFALSKTQFQFNQFGGSIGGPIVHDKLFFFADYQGTTINSAAPNFFNVPTQPARVGDFSSLLPKTVIYDPQTTPRAPFANNMIPLNRLDPAVAKMVALLPQPTLSGAFNYLANVLTRSRTHAFDYRVDYHIDERNALFTSMTFIQTSSTSAPPFGRASGFSITPDAKNPVRRPGLNYTHIFGPSAINELIIGYNRDNLFGPETAGNQYEPDLGIKYLNQSAGDVRNNGFPLMIVPGYSVFGGPLGGPFSIVQNTPQVADNFSWNKGRHLFKAGFTFKARQLNVSQAIYPRGYIIFNALETSNAGAGGDALASTMLGYELVGIRDNQSPYGQRSKEYGAYFQDTFKVSSRLTLNLGVRYDLFPPSTEAYGRVSNFDFTTKSVVLAGQNGVSDSTLAANKRNFGPHLGFAYTPTHDQRTVLRGGYQINYAPLMTSAPGTDVRLTMNIPYRQTASTTFDPFNPTVRVSDGLPFPAIDLKNPSGSFFFLPVHNPYPYMQQWNFDVQHALGQSFLLDVAYAGSHGVHLPGNVNVNQAPPGPGSSSSRSLISPLLNSLTGLFNRESSIYHALQVKLERQFSEGFYLIVGYTFSKSIDDGSYTSNSGVASSTTPQDNRNWRAERGVSDFDVPHRLVMSYIYELPFGKGKHFLSRSSPWINGALGGWQVNGITTAQSGGPFTPVVSNAKTNAGGGGSIRPDRIGSGNVPSGQQSIYHWFDKSAFLVQGASPADPDPYHFGNSGRNILRGPDLVNFDFSLFKYFPITERLKLQFRGEFFNVFNHPNFNIPSASVDTAQGGVITSARGPRIIQFALKLAF